MSSSAPRSAQPRYRWPCSYCAHSLHSAPLRTAWEEDKGSSLRLFIAFFDYSHFHPNAPALATDPTPVGIDQGEILLLEIGHGGIVRIQSNLHHALQVFVTFW